MLFATISRSTLARAPPVNTIFADRWLLIRARASTVVELKRETGNDGADVLCCFDVEGYDSKVPGTKTKATSSKKKAV